jgi:putative nucleotidyltransferase with HDIG domain
MARPSKKSDVDQPEGVIFRIDGPGTPRGYHVRAGVRQRSVALVGAALAAPGSDWPASNIAAAASSESADRVDTASLAACDAPTPKGLWRSFRDHFAMLHRLAQNPVVWEIDERAVVQDLRMTLALTETGVQQLMADQPLSDVIPASEGIAAIERVVGERARGLTQRVELLSDLRRLVLWLSASIDHTRLGAVPAVAELAEWGAKVVRAARADRPPIFILVRGGSPADRLAAHAVTVAQLAVRLAPHDSEQHADLEVLAMSALLQDFGMIDVPGEILESAEPLTGPQRQIIEQHPAASAALAERMRVDERVVHAVYQHHERLDGSGYGAQLAGDAIGRIGRLLAVVDSFAGMQAPRAYRPALNWSQAQHEVRLAARCGKLDATLVARLPPGPPHWLILDPGADAPPGARAVPAQPAYAA